jgi:outer membrane biosynthesis protein TonB
VGILVFAVSGLGLYAVVSLVKNAPPKENNTAAENINGSQTPETTPSVEEKVFTTEGAGETNTETIPDTLEKETQKTPTMVAQPTPSPTTRIPVEQPPKTTPTAKPPPVDKTPRPPQSTVRYVLCYVKSDYGTINKVRKSNCHECPPKTACELIF